MVRKLFSELTEGELYQIVKDALNEVLTNNQSQQPTAQTTESEKLLKCNEVAELLSVSAGTVGLWKSSGKIPFYRISNKVYYKYSEILEVLKKGNL
jgi:hypothetical protein